MPENSPLISSANHPTGRTTVVITAHNYGRYLAWCIHSVLAQTLRPARIIVIDDASEDDTEKVARGFIPRVEYHRVEYRNAQRTRNFGLRKATSEYVIFLDADDFISDTMIEKLERTLDDHPEARLAYCDKYVFGDPASIRKLRLTYYWKVPEFSIEHLRFSNFITTASLIRRNFLTEFDEHIRKLQDWDTWLGMLQSNEHAIRVPEPLLHYRVHGSNISLTRRELLERLKIIAKHGLIRVAQLGANASQEKRFTRNQEMVVFATSKDLLDTDVWRDLTERVGCRVRVITTQSNAGDGFKRETETVSREGNVIVQTAVNASLDELLWRFTGVISNPDLAAVVALGDIGDIANTQVFAQGTQPTLWSKLDLREILRTSSLEELGTFVLSPEAARLLVYLPPASSISSMRRLTHAAREYYSRHIGWRFARAKS